MDHPDERRTDTAPDLSCPKLNDGRDEMNLAEFPLCAIADRLHPDQKTMIFEDRVWDASRGEMITRQLTITGSDEYGLPTALDDEVLLGLIQVSKLHDFASRQVPFTRYQLIQLLNWRDDSKSYERLEKSLNRWMGVTLYYQNAWWNKAQQCWVDETFHILDNVTLFDREAARRRAARTHQTQLPLSNFVWNTVVFQSFLAGNLKRIDFDFFKSLKSVIAKRLYRFLDKRFFHRDRWEFNLKELAWEHVGLARSYDVAGLRRRLQPAVAELERQGFLQPLDPAERFLKVSSGEWRVVFQRAQADPKPLASTNGHSAEALRLQEALVQRGVTPFTAQETVSQHPSDRIQAQLEVFDWLVARQDPKVSRNPAGFLISAIKSQYVPPKGFLTREEREQRIKRAAARKERMEQRRREQAMREQQREMAKEREIEQFWASLSAIERSRLEREALAQAPALQRNLVRRGGSFAASARKTILSNYALKLMQLEG